MIKTCQICNKNFYVKPSHYNKRFCCSKQCQNLNQKNKTGSKNNNWKGGVKEQICNYCGCSFIPNFPYHKRNYCSHKCSSNASIGNKMPDHVKQKFLKYIEYKKEKGKNNPNKICKCGNKKDLKAKECLKCFNKNKKQRKIKTCMLCNKTFYKKGYYQKYCSDKCFKESRTKWVGDKNPNWKGGVKYKSQIGRYTTKYNQWRVNVFERDNYTCQKCGQIGNKLHAHHIKSWAKHKNKRYLIENGITLCKKCHKYEHKINGFK